MDTCRATRVLVPALLVAIVVSSLGGSDVLAWIAAAATATVLVAVQRVRRTAAACAVRPPEAAEPPQDVTPSRTPEAGR